MANRDPKRGDLQPIRVISESKTQQHFIKDREGRVMSNLSITLCPFLGSHDDPATARSFVTPQNCCYHVHPAATVKSEHQRVFCLSYNYHKCRIFRHQTEIKLPPKRSQKVQKGGFALPALLVCLFIIFAAIVLASITW